MPLLSLPSLPPGAQTKLDDCPPLCLARARSCALTVECAYAEGAPSGLRLHVRTSTDGVRYDTEDVRTLDVPCRPGQMVRTTFDLGARAMFAKVLVENPGPRDPVSNVGVDTTLGGGVG